MVNCPNCGYTDNNPEARYCSRCGGALPVSSFFSEYQEIRKKGRTGFGLLSLALAISISLLGGLAFSIVHLSVYITFTNPLSPVNSPTATPNALPTSQPVIIITQEPPTATPTTIPTAIPTPHTNVYHFVVNANQSPPGLDTGINLTSGEKLTITAEGYAAYSSGADPADGCSTTTDPNGDRPNNGNPCPPKAGDSYATCPSANYGELVASFSSSGWFPVGSNYSTDISTDGRLFLLYNDSYWNDNSGNYQVTVTVTNT